MKYPTTDGDRLGLYLLDERDLLRFLRGDVAIINLPDDAKLEAVNYSPMDRGFLVRVYSMAFEPVPAGEQFPMKGTLTLELKIRPGWYGPSPLAKLWAEFLKLKQFDLDYIDSQRYSAFGLPQSLVGWESNLSPYRPDSEQPSVDWGTVQKPGPWHIVPDEDGPSSLVGEPADVGNRTLPPGFSAADGSDKAKAGDKVYFQAGTLLPGDARMTDTERMCREGMARADALVAEHEAQVRWPSWEQPNVPDHPEEATYIDPNWVSNNNPVGDIKAATERMLADVESGDVLEDGTCPDCKGSGEYYGVSCREPCQRCGGKGQLV